MSAPSDALGDALGSCPHCGEVHGEAILKCPNTDRPLPLEGRILAGKFRFRRELGVGGMASVWLAVNEKLDREVAIKLLRSEVTKNREAVERFLSEARAAARIGSEHIADVYDVGEGPLGPFIVMEALVGHDLAELLAEREALGPEELIPIILDVLDALGAAHDAGIVHRDLKPGNIFLHYPLPGRPNTKLMDFGVSKFLDGSGPVHTREGILLGTPEYMAPEQLKGAANMDTRADIFSTGAVMYRALTGHFVFEGESMAEVLVNMSKGELVPVDERVPDLPPSFVAVVHKALAIKPEDRYASAHEMAQALIEVRDALYPDNDAAASRSEADATDALLALSAQSAERPLVPPKPASSGRSAVGVWAGVAGLLLVGALAFWWVQGRSEGTTTASGAASTGAPTGADLPAQGSESSSAGDFEYASPDLAGGADAAIVDLPAEPTDEAGDAAADVEGDDEGEALEDAGDEVDEEAGGDDEEVPEDAEEGGATPEPTSPLPETAPAGSYRVDDMLALYGRERTDTHAAARKFCAGLAAKQHLGVAGWRLPNPSEARRFIGNTAVKTGTYWTSALWKGKAIAFRLPSGKKSSERAERKVARAFCVTKG